MFRVEVMSAPLLRLCRGQAVPMTFVSLIPHLIMEASVWTGRRVTALLWFCASLVTTPASLAQAQTDFILSSPPGNKTLRGEALERFETLSRSSLLQGVMQAVLNPRIASSPVLRIPVDATMGLSPTGSRSGLRTLYAVRERLVPVSDGQIRWVSSSIDHRRRVSD